MYIGLDVHKDTIQIISVKNAASKVLDSREISSRIDSITEFAKSLSKKDHVVLESTTHSSPIATLLRQNGAHVTISNPFKTKMIADSKIKTDKIDAETLARLLASNYIPSVWQPSLEVEELRKIVSFAITEKSAPPILETVPEKQRLIISSPRPSASKICAPR